MKDVLNFIKAHLFALMCAVVAIAALAAYFIYPLPGQIADLQGELEKRRPVYDQLTAQLKSSRTLPVVSIDGGEPVKLQPFPTRRIIDQGKAILARLQDEAKQVYDAAVARNELQPLVPGALPEGGSIARKQFLDEYRRVTVQTGPGAENGIVRTVLRGAILPTAAEIDAAYATQATQLTTQLLRLDSNNQPVNQDEVNKALAEMRSKLPLRLRSQRALNSQMYVSPNAVQVNGTLLGAALPPDAVTAFNAQYHIWIQTMVFQSLTAANGNAKTILDAPIKHLLSLNVPMSVVPGGGGGGGFGQEQVAPAAGTAGPELKDDPTIAIAPDFAADPLGFHSNAMYDNVVIQMTLRVSAAKLPSILASLQSAKLLKVRNLTMRPVDIGTAAAEGYVYDKDGSTPLVEVALDCDLLVLRRWMIPFMPPTAKTYFASMTGSIGAGGR